MALDTMTVHKSTMPSLRPMGGGYGRNRFLGTHRDTGGQMKKQPRWDRPVKYLVICLSLPLFCWLIWQGPFVREAVVGRLAGIGSFGVPVLRKALLDVHPKVRGAARKTWAQIGPDAVPPLVKVLTDKNTSIRAEAAFALGCLQEDGKLQDQDSSVRARAAEALWKVDRDARAALPVLMKLLNDADADVRAGATEALGVIGRDDKTVPPMLIDMLKDPAVKVRFEAVEGWGKLTWWMRALWRPCGLPYTTQAKWSVRKLPRLC
jgi:HEAT repeats